MKTMAQVERDAILSAIAELGGKTLSAAKALGISKTSIYRKLHDYGYRRRDNGPIGQAIGLASIKQSRFLLLPITREQQAAADLKCPACQSPVLMPNHVEEFANSRLKLTTLSDNLPAKIVRLRAERSIRLRLRNK